MISTNQGEPLVGTNTMAGQAYRDICERILGKDVPVITYKCKKRCPLPIAKPFWQSVVREVCK